ELVQRLPHPLFQRVPQAAQRTGPVMDTQAVRLGSGVLLAISRLIEERLAQDEQHRAKRELRRRPRQPVAARRPRRTLDDAGAAQLTQELLDIDGRQVLGEGDLTGGERMRSRRKLGQAQQAPQSVLFLGRDLHAASPASAAASTWIV